VATGTDVTYAVKTDGTLWSWGVMVLAVQLGTGTQTSKSSPVQVGALTTWADTFAGETGLLLALQQVAHFMSWGYNFNGRLGVGNTTNYSSPVQIGALTTWNTELPAIGSYARVLL
jgi:alpha-tubulin suppressor-like RCC1 family protein